MGTRTRQGIKASNVPMRIVSKSQQQEAKREKKDNIYYRCSYYITQSSILKLPADVNQLATSLACIDL